jgi:hypothetical protein
MKLIRNAKLILILVFICGTYCSKTSTESESKISGGINLSEAMMKSKDGDGAAMKDLEKSVGAADDDDKTNDGPIFHSQWIKYFKFFNFGDSAPKHFFKNGEFKEQSKYFPDADINATSDDGFGQKTRTYIKDSTDFYLTVFDHNVNFLTSRQQLNRKVVDVLTFASIEPISETPKNPTQTKDGIDDFGNFSEGFCFKVDADGKKTVWILCSETQQLKETLFNILRQRKIEEQRSRGVYNISSKPPDMSGAAGDAKKQQQNDAIKNSNKNAGATDGYWITIQEWSKCNLKCGGGEEVFQRLCVPPKTGGAPCEGESVLRRPCNTQPCQEVGNSDDPLGSQGQNKTQTLPPIVKVMPFSTRPQRYSKCVVKESDMMFENNPSHRGASNSKNSNDGPSQLPVRVVMNNRTIVVYGGEDYSSQIITLDIDKSDFRRENLNPNKNLKKCFSIVSSETGEKATLCPFVAADSKAVEEWDYDFNLFKNQCHQSREKLQMEFKFNSSLQDKIKQAKKDVLEEREAEIKQKSGNMEMSLLQDKRKQTKDTTLKAIQKELNLEDMIKSEEEEREKIEDKEMLERIDDEKKKSDCLLKAIKEKAMENQFKKKLESEKKDIKSLEESAREQVTKRINVLKQKIWEMKSESKSRKQSMMQQLQEVRMSMAENLNKAYKRGDPENCKVALSSKKNSVAYCTANYGANPNTFTVCIGTITSQQRFCNHCCNTEFGSLLEEEQNKCKAAVCAHQPNEPIKSAAEKGVWVFQDAVKTQ